MKSFCRFPSEQCQALDACSGAGAAFVYPAHTFAAYVFDGIVGESVGDWAACPICHELI
jgi:hypothetical protein